MKGICQFVLLGLILSQFTGCSGSGGGNASSAPDTAVQSARVAEAVSKIETHQTNVVERVDVLLEVLKQRPLTADEVNTFKDFLFNQDALQLIPDAFFEKMNVLFLTHKMATLSNPISVPAILDSSRTWYYMPKSSLGNYAWGGDDWFKVTVTEAPYDIDFEATNIADPSSVNKWPYQYPADQFPLNEDIAKLQPSAALRYRMKASSVTKLVMRSSKDSNTTTFPWAAEIRYLTISDKHIAEATNNLIDLFPSALNILNQSPSVNSIVLLQLKEHLHQDFERIIAKIRLYRTP